VNRGGSQLELSEAPLIGLEIERKASITAKTELILCIAPNDTLIQITPAARHYYLE
jgi:hypothetical protein